MPDTNSTVLVIDDDPNLRASVGRLLGSLRLESSAGWPHLSGPRREIARAKAVLIFQRELAAANRGGAPGFNLIKENGHGKDSG